MTPLGAGDGLTVRFMALAGSALIAGVAVLIVVSGLAGGWAGGRSRLGSSSIEPASTSAGGGPACVAATGDLLCHEKEQSSSADVTSHDPVIRVEGPGAVALTDPTLMIDGKQDTAWTSGGEATGLQIILQFNEPVTVGMAGLTSSGGRRVLAATWSFSPPATGSAGLCASVPGAFGSPVRQDLSASATQRISPAIRTCAVRVQLDQLARVTGPGAGSAAISELVLRAP